MEHPDYIITCKNSRLFFSDLYQNAIVVSNARAEAMRFDDEMAAQRAIDKMLKPFYPSFSWRAVPAEV